MASRTLTGTGMSKIEEVELGALHKGIRVSCIGRDGSRYAYVAPEAGEWLVVIDGEIQARCESVLETGPVFSPDAGRWACSVGYRGEKGMIIDGRLESADDSLA